MIDTLKNLIKFIRSKKCYIEESVFRWHCLYTSMILFFFFLIITTKQIVGEPIDCDTNRDAIKPTVLNTYCLIHYTYSIREGFNKRVGHDVASPGVRFGYTENEIQYHYYQWIWFLFFIEALFFYFPRWLWRGLENGVIHHLIFGINIFSKGKGIKNKKSFIINFLIDNKRHNDSYARKYLFCLILAFFNVFFQIYSINFLFNGEFLTYGIQIFPFLWEDPDLRRDALIKVFPRVTKCRFHKYGPSGSIEELDSLCVLPLNMYNEKIFVFLWFWFSILALLLFATIGIKIIVIISSTVRSVYVRKVFGLKKEVKRLSKDNINKDDIFSEQHLSFGEIIVLLLIKENAGFLFTREVVKELIQKHRIRKTTIIDKPNPRDNSIPKDKSRENLIIAMNESNRGRKDSKSGSNETKIGSNDNNIYPFNERTGSNQIVVDIRENDLK